MIDKAKLRENVSQLPFNYSTWVALLIVYLLEWWHDPANAAAKAQIVASMPILDTFKEAIALGLWLLSRSWPQDTKPATPPPIELTTDEVVALKAVLAKRKEPSA